MFTGIIEATGRLDSLRQTAVAGTFQLVLRTALARELSVGDSVANNGCCLTVVSCAEETVVFDLLAETLYRTNLSDLKPGDLVNLERAMRGSGRFDGHIVQGHVDVAAEIVAIEALGRDHRLEIQLPGDFVRYVVSKGSIAVNGISLTVAHVNETTFANWIIPLTWQATNLHTLKVGQRVNLEFDPIAKYVEKIMKT